MIFVELTIFCIFLECRATYFISGIRTNGFKKEYKELTVVPVHIVTFQVILLYS